MEMDSMIALAMDALINGVILQIEAAVQALALIILVEILN